MKPKYRRILSPASVTRSQTVIRPYWAIVYQPPDTPGPHLLELHPNAYVRTHGNRLWIFTPKGVTQ